MESRSISQFVIITVFAMVILTVNDYQIKFVFSQDEETPDFGGTKAPFTPLSEDERNPPPPPSNATQVNELPKNLFVTENDTDTEPLAIANITELLEVLPANATSAIKFIDQSLKNSTGQGLLPPGVLNNVTDAGLLNMSTDPTEEKRNITTILDFLNKENLTQEILPLISPANTSATSEDLEEIEEPEPSNVSENATSLEEQPDNETALSTTSSEDAPPTPKTNETDVEQPSNETALSTTSSEDAPPTPKTNETDVELPGNDEELPPISQESGPPPLEDKGQIGIEEPLNNTKLELSNNTGQGLLNNTELELTKDTEQ